MPYLYYPADECLIEVEDASSILDASLDAGIPHTHICGGSARCSTCRVWVVEGLEHCTDRTYAERQLANQLGFDDRMRLACQTQVYGEGKVVLRRLTLDQDDLELVNDQVRGKANPIGQEKKIAILFADIRGFTAFSEALPPYDVIYVLNRYFHQMGKVISQSGGMINNYMGDGLMALFGWDDPELAAEQAVRSGLAMLEAMERFNDYLESLYQRRLEIGIGIHYGEAVIGIVGASLQSQQMTAIGDAVNLASRIEAANKQIGTRLLISEATYHQVKEKIWVNQVRKVEIPGKRGEYLLYEVKGIQGELAIDEKARSSVAGRSPRWQVIRSVLVRWWKRCAKLWKKR